MPVIWVQHSIQDLAYGSPEWQWVPELVPADGEPLIHKHFNSSFEETALERGYDLTLIKDALTTGSMALDDGVRIEASNVIQELNIAMTWVRYPGRTNGTATVEEIDFAAPGGVRQVTVAAPSAHPSNPPQSPALSASVPSLPPLP